MRKFVWGGLIGLVLAVGAIAYLVLASQGKDTQCFAEFDSSASAEAAAAEGRAAGFDVSHQSGNVAGAFIFETGKTGDEEIPLERSFDRIVTQHHGHFGGSAHCVEHTAFD
jgi:hypothetical protein